MNLAETLRKPEGKTLEFKRDLSSPDGFLRTVVAFANTSGGTVLIGVEDRSGHIRGVTDPLDLEERAANLISDSIRPRLLPDLEIASWRNTHPPRSAKRTRPNAPSPCRAIRPRCENPPARALRRHRRCPLPGHRPAMT